MPTYPQEPDDETTRRLRRMSSSTRPNVRRPTLGQMRQAQTDPVFAQRLQENVAGEYGSALQRYGQLAAQPVASPIASAARQNMLARVKQEGAGALSQLDRAGEAVKLGVAPNQLEQAKAQQAMQQQALAQARSQQGLTDAQAFLARGQGIGAVAQPLGDIGSAIATAWGNKLQRDAQIAAQRQQLQDQMAMQQAQLQAQQNAELARSSAKSGDSREAARNEYYQQQMKDLQPYLYTDTESVDPVTAAKTRTRTRNEDAWKQYMGVTKEYGGLVTGGGDMARTPGPGLADTPVPGAAGAPPVSSSLSEVSSTQQAAGLPPGTPYRVNRPDGGYSAGVTPGKVRVSNGKETYDIDPKDLQAATADGFQPV